jgi:nitroreductase
MDDPILARRSIRHYTEADVSSDDVQYLLTAAMAAPSAGNQQPWHFILIRDRASLDRIREFHDHSRMLEEAQLAILVCGDTTDLKYDELWDQDCSAATQNILLAAQARGLGSCWLGVHPFERYQEPLAEMFGIPDGILPFSIIALGHPTETKPPAERFDEGRIHDERW